MVSRDGAWGHCSRSPHSRSAIAAGYDGGMDPQPYQSPQGVENRPKSFPGSGRSVRSIAVEAVFEFVLARYFWQSQHSVPLTMIFATLGLYASLQLYRKTRANRPPKNS